jgi:hypothetical protein
VISQLGRSWEKLSKLEAERAALEAKLEGIEAEGNVITLHPAAIAKFASSIEALHDGLKQADANPAAMASYRAAFRNVFDSSKSSQPQRGIPTP